MGGKYKRKEVWLDQSGKAISWFGVHPGTVLSYYISWQRPTGAWATIPDPEPDTLNVAVLADSPIMLDLPHVYFAKIKGRQPLWISFGRSDDPLLTIDSVREPWLARWVNMRAHNPRVYQYREIPVLTYAKDIPQDQRWQHAEQFCEM